MDISGVPLLPSFLLVGVLALAVWDLLSIPSIGSLDRIIARDGIATQMDESALDERRTPADRRVAPHYQLHVPSVMAE